MAVNLLTSEEKNKALMREVSRPQEFINPNYQSGQLHIQTPDVQPDFDFRPKNIGIGEGTPDTQVRNIEGDATGYIKSLSDKFGVSQQFGNKSSMYKSGSHPGLDIRTPVGTEIVSPIEGRVVTGYDPTGWGKYVQVHSPDGTIFQFSHLSDIDDLIKEVNKMKDGLIKKGQVLGKTGGALTDSQRGLSTGAHLDISVKRGGKFINPLGRS